MLMRYNVFAAGCILRRGIYYFVSERLEFVSDIKHSPVITALLLLHYL